MYKPKYSITNRLMRSIATVEACKEVIENAPLVPAWEAKFRTDAMVRSVYHGTHLEGNGLNYQEAGKLLAGGKVTGRERDIQEVLNYRNVLKYIQEYEKKHITEPVIKKMHELTVYRILPEEAIATYRKNQVVVKNSQTGEVTFRPPPAIEVPFLVDEFLNWLGSISDDEVHSVVKAALTHYELVRIHPFLDGNGRVARATATLSLFLDGYDVKRFFSLEEHYDKEPIHYYTSLQEVAKMDGDTTVWIEYFAEGLAIELTRIKEKVKSISTDLKIKKSLGGHQMSLTERQIRIIEYIQENGFLQNKAFFELFPMISEDTVLRELKDLQKKGILKKEGTTKGVKYLIKT